MTLILAFIFGILIGWVIKIPYLTKLDIERSRIDEICKSLRLGNKED